MTDQLPPETIARIHQSVKERKEEDQVKVDSHKEAFFQEVPDIKDTPGINEAVTKRARDAVATQLHLLRKDRDIQRQNETISELSDAALTDHLTGLPNEKAFIDRLNEEISYILRREEGDRRLGILYTDLKNFKKINDTYGHKAGDEVLKELANFLRSHLRAGDFAARLHGDEIAIGIVGGDIETAIERFNELGTTELPKEIAHNLKNKNIDIGTTQVLLHVGGTIFEQGDDAKSLMNRADMLMNEHKNQNPYSR